MTENTGSAGNPNERSIDATPQRTAGKRIIDAPLVELNLPALIEQIKQEPAWNDGGHNSITIYKSAGMRIVLMGLHDKGELKPHKAKGVISVQVLEGSIQFATEEKTVVITKGAMIALQENIVHSVIARAQSFFLLTLAVGQ